MLNKINCSVKNLALVVIIAVLLYMALNEKPRESYTLSPGAVTVKSTGSIDDFFNAPYKLECAPSAEEGGAYYTKDLTPGGLCGGQDIVNNLMHRYSIEDGIGGSLLDD